MAEGLGRGVSAADEPGAEFEGIKFGIELELIPLGRSKVHKIAASSRASLAPVFKFRGKKKGRRIRTQLIKAQPVHPSSTAPLSHEKTPNGHLYLASSRGKGMESPRNPLA